MAVVEAGLPYSLRGGYKESFPNVAPNSKLILCPPVNFSFSHLIRDSVSSFHLAPVFEGRHSNAPRFYQRGEKSRVNRFKLAHYRFPRRTDSHRFSVRTV